MYEVFLICHVVICVFLISLVLLQQGKGAQAGAAFGSGASQTVFGSQGSGGFLSRATGVLAALFFMTSLFLAYWVNKENRRAYAPPPPVVAPQEQQKEPKTDLPSSSIPAS